MIDSPEIMEKYTNNYFKKSIDFFILLMYNIKKKVMKNQKIIYKEI